VNTDKIPLPTFEELVTYYGPYLALVLAIIIAFLIMQFVWFKRVLQTKDEEIKRLVSHEKELNKRIMQMIDERIKNTKDQPPESAKKKKEDTNPKNN
jgi:ABC-type bacteriocin/lantibiotic exporter with double-glycine peptidase domain